MGYIHVICKRNVKYKYLLDVPYLAREKFINFDRIVYVEETYMYICSKYHGMHVQTHGLYTCLSACVTVLNIAS